MTTKLTENLQPKRRFDPCSPRDLREFDFYLLHGHWESLCPFVPDHPYLDVITSCLQSFARTHVGEVARAVEAEWS